MKIRKMQAKEFMDSIRGDRLPEGLTAELQALWYDAKGDWDRAHDIAQDIPGRSGAHIHAYLHRKEGDQWNAGYWYRLAGREMPDKSLDLEWQDLVDIFLPRV